MDSNHAPEGYPPYQHLDRLNLLIFGSMVIAPTGGSIEIVNPGERGQNLVTAKLIICKYILAQNPVDFRGEVKVLAWVGEEITQVFTGFVDVVNIGDIDATISLVTSITFLAEQRSGGMGFDDHADLLEVASALTKESHPDPNRVLVPESLRPLIEENFVVSVPLQGVECYEDVGVGSIVITGQGWARELAEGLGPAELVDEYQSSNSFAVAHLVASRMIDAETLAIGRIDAHLALLQAQAHFTGSLSPDGRNLEFRRKWLSGRVRRRNVVVVKAQSSLRRWIRAMGDFQDNSILETIETTRFEKRSFNVVPISQSLSGALMAWKRAAETPDGFEAIVALWESIEFCVAGMSVENLFSKDEIHLLKDLSTEGLSGEKRDKVKRAIESLNEPPLQVRLRGWLDQNKIPYNSDELKELSQLRKVRNYLVHGRGAVRPKAHEIARAVSFVNRMIVHAYWLEQNVIRETMR